MSTANEHKYHSPAYGCPLSLANTGLCAVSLSHSAVIMRISLSTRITNEVSTSDDCTGEAPLETGHSWASPNTNGVWAEAAILGGAEPNGWWARLMCGER